MPRIHIFIFALLALAIGATVWLTSRAAVPRFQGKDVYEWMFESKSSALENNPGLMAIGSNAVPFIAEALALDQTRYDRHRWVRSPAVQRTARRLGLGFTWTKSASEVQHSAAWSLLAFSFEAKHALPEIHRDLLRTKNGHRQLMVHCLSEMGCPPESIPVLVKAWPLTTNESYNVRHDLLHLFGLGGTNAAKLAMPIAVEALSDGNWNVRVVAAQTLGRWGQPNTLAIPPLLALLNSTNGEAAMSAASALGRMTNRCDEAVPGVRRLMASTNDYTVAVAAITLWRLGGDVTEARRTLESLLGSKRGKGGAANFLGQMGPVARDSVPALLKASQESIGAWVDMYDRAQCAKAVLRIGGESAEAYAVLEEAITTEKNGWVRGTMCREIAQLKELARPLLPALRKALNDPSRDVRHEAARALLRLQGGE
ncbi:MAG TPA: HEAT repeat domain-containing protein [Methylomirabilota bacterium]|nr:HEAT repeat domain-containing protein [Methylomirabilota bacterium]